MLTCQSEFNFRPVNCASPGDWSIHFGNLSHFRPRFTARIFKITIILRSIQANPYRMIDL